MIRKIIQINEEKCNGCGLCAKACEEGAIAMIDGKAKLVREDYCDGLGNCLPVCPMEAISFEDREAPAFQKKAQKITVKEKETKHALCGCLGSSAQVFERESEEVISENVYEPTSQLRQWPVQIKLVSTQASYFNSAKLLIAADCTAYAYANLHGDFIKDHVTLIGCPKLDEGDYTPKLAEIIQNNDIQSITIVRMQVPCCSSLEFAVRNAVKDSRKTLPLKVVVISTDGKIVQDK